jgi:hypothetical protein
MVSRTEGDLGRSDRPHGPLTSDSRTKRCSADDVPAPGVTISFASSAGRPRGTYCLRSTCLTGMRSPPACVGRLQDRV